MEDAIRPTKQAFKAISFSNTILARGKTTWGTTTTATEQSPCDHGLDLPSFEKDFSIQIAADRPVILELSETQNGFSGCEFLRCLREGKCEGEGDHIAILILAWTYILSARWAEIIPGVNDIEYSTSQAQWRNDETSAGEAIVGLGDVDDDAARWWAAVLAPEGGWTATISTNKGHLLHSPWHTKVISEQPFILSRSSTSSSSSPPPTHCSPASFTTALSYLSSYIDYHNVAKQSEAALAATLFLPVAGFENRRVLLPIPRTPQNGRPNPNLTTITKPPAWSRNPQHVDSLLTLSCNTIGIKSLLNSIFFEPGVESNICGAWVQGTFEFLDSGTLQDESQHTLLRVLVKRDPSLAFLWLGAFMTGAQKRALREVWQGWWKIDLNAAAWTGTLVSFVQEPVSRPCLGSGYESEPGVERISRADECRLLYLSHKQSYTVTPLFPFAPFGWSALGDTNIEVRQHAKCEIWHGLEFESLKWRCQDPMYLETATPFLCRIPLWAKNGQSGNSEVAVTYKNLDYEDDECSEMVTRYIFTWLRDEDGFPLAERDIRKHEWIENLDYSDEDECPITGDARSTLGGNLHGWLGKTVTWRSNSL
ncbi:hypothetical protein ACEPPN_007784 [Leptodophora sp. 'Broadleaf-Isolate-01']